MKRMRLIQKTFLIFIVAVLFVGCGTNNRISQNVDEGEFAVYKSLLKDKSKGPVVIDNGIVDAIGFDESSLKSEMKRIDTETVADFIAKDKKTPVVRNGSQIKKGFPVFSREEFKKKHKEHEIPLSFSRVGFNSDKSEALVWFSDFRTPLGGKAGLFLMRKVEGSWRIVEESEKVVS